MDPANDKAQPVAPGLGQKAANGNKVSAIGPHVEAVAMWVADLVVSCLKPREDPVELPLNKAARLVKRRTADVMEAVKSKRAIARRDGRRWCINVRSPRSWAGAA